MKVRAGDRDIDVQIRHDVLLQPFAEVLAELGG
jgi:hypothetical protein